MARMTYYIYEDAKFLGRPIVRDRANLSKVLEYSQEDVMVAGVGMCVVGEYYTITEWVARNEGEMFDISQATKKPITKNMDNEETLDPRKWTQAMIDKGEVKVAAPAENLLKKRTSELNRTKNDDLKAIIETAGIKTEASKKEEYIAAILAHEFPDSVA